jgi:hydroxyacylglutathione hydrolase
VLEIKLVRVLGDNYAHLLHDPETGAAAVVDPGEAEPVLAAVESMGWTLGTILLTHHQADHIRRRRRDQGRHRLPRRRRRRRPFPHPRRRRSRSPTAIPSSISARPTPWSSRCRGNTSGHVAYWFRADDALFAAIPCSRWAAAACSRALRRRCRQSLSRLRALPDEPWSIAATNTPRRTPASRWPSTPTTTN